MRCGGECLGDWFGTVFLMKLATSYGKNIKKLADAVIEAVIYETL